MGKKLILINLFILVLLVGFSSDLSYAKYEIGKTELTYNTTNVFDSGSGFTYANGNYYIVTDYSVNIGTQRTIYEFDETFNTTGTTINTNSGGCEEGDPEGLGYNGTHLAVVGTAEDFCSYNINTLNFSYKKSLPDNDYRCLSWQNDSNTWFTGVSKPSDDLFEYDSGFNNIVNQYNTGSTYTPVGIIKDGNNYWVPDNQTMKYFDANFNSYTDTLDFSSVIDNRIQSAFVHDNKWHILTNGDMVYIISTTSLTVELISPADKLQTNNTNITIEYNVSAEINGSLSCNLYVDSNNVSSQTHTNDGLYNFSYNFSNGYHDYYVECNGSTTTTQKIFVDSQHPLIKVAEPSVFNDTAYYESDIINLTGNVTNINISRVNRTIYYPNGSEAYFNETTNFADVTFYEWDEQLNFSGYPYGFYEYVINAEDQVDNKNKRSMLFEYCRPNYVCVEYGYCEGGVQKCTEVNDTNNCTETYGGNFSEFDKNCTVYQVGDGTIGNPYEINNCSQLSNIRYNLTASYELVSDVECSGFSMFPIGNDTDNSYRFSGNLFGNSYSIKNLTVKGSNQHLGLFGSIQNASINNIKIVNMYFNGTSNADELGTITGDSRGSTYNNITVYGKIDYGQYQEEIGGLIGVSQGDLIKNVNVSLNINNNPRSAGGIAYATSQNTLIEECFTTGQMNIGYRTGTNGVGGIVGVHTDNSIINNSYSKMDIWVNQSTNTYAGGIAGYIGISNQYASINHTYYSGYINNTNGVEYGISGNITDTFDIDNSYWDVTKNPHINVSNGGINKTTTEMQQQSTYTNWDFVNVWKINEGSSYPYFRSQSLNLTTIQLIVTSPKNQSFFNSDGIDIDYELYPFGQTVTCDLYVDGSNIDSETHTSASNYSFSNINFGQGFHNFSVRCSSVHTTNNSGRYRIFVDSQHPLIKVAEPSVFNDTAYYESDIINLTGNVTNINISRVNRTIYYPNGSEAYFNETTNFADVTFYEWDEQLNFSGYPYGFYEFKVEAEDTVNNSNSQVVTFEYCHPEWVCIGYGDCVNGTQECNEVSDVNGCTDTYDGDYSEFDTQNCTIEDNETNETITGYVADYQSGDLPKSMLSLVVKSIITVTKYLAIIVVFFVALYLGNRWYQGYKQ